MTCSRIAATHNRETVDGLEPCAPGYTNMGLTCTRGANTYDREKVEVKFGSCPEGYNTTPLTCSRIADTKTNPNIGVGDAASLLCPEGTKEASPGGICYPNNPPEGYQRHSISLEQWTEKCPNEWSDTGWYCTRPSKSVIATDAVCPTDYTDYTDYTDNSIDTCKKNCETGYESIKDKCVQKCPENTINNTETTCGREKKIINIEEYNLPYKYKIKNII